jgi:hypothetical protein
MRIVYSAWHRLDDQDEGGGVSYVLKQLGHEVVRVRQGGPLPKDGDMVLFHHGIPADLSDCLIRPKCFWYFDLVDFPGDALIAARCQTRMGWQARALPLVDLGFLNDGDWVLNDKSGKLHTLHEGADERYVGRGLVDERYTIDPQGDIVFVGSPRGGMDRFRWYQEMSVHYGGRFTTIGWAEQNRVYQRALANALRRFKIAICPPAPVTDHYWSSRVYLMTAFGAFTMHAWADDLSREFEDGKEIVFFKGHDDMFAKLDYYLDAARDGERERIALAGMKRAHLDHCYRNRVARMLEIVNQWKVEHGT